MGLRTEVAVTKGAWLVTGWAAEIAADTYAWRAGHVEGMRSLVAIYEVARGRTAGWAARLARVTGWLTHPPLTWRLAWPTRGG